MATPRGRRAIRATPLCVSLSPFLKSIPRTASNKAPLPSPMMFTLVELEASASEKTMSAAVGCVSPEVQAWTAKSGS